MKKTEEIFALRDAWYEQAKQQSLGTLKAFLEELASYEHDYNTICYACAAAAVGATWAMDRTEHGGITGFQAGAIMWEYLGAWNDIRAPAWLHKGEDMLYPQNQYKFTTISRETWKWLQERALAKLEEKSGFTAHPDVIAHWKTILAGTVPFNYTIRDFL